jgi:heptosyltransferase II
MEAKKLMNRRNSRTHDNTQYGTYRTVAVKRLLVRGTNWLGDAVMATPALMRLREEFPATHMALLTPEKLDQLWLHHPAVDEVLTFSQTEGIFAVSRKLRAGKFDAALVLPNSPRSALEVFLAGIPIRIGYAQPWRNLFLTQTVAPRPGAAIMRKRTAGEIKALTESNAKTGIRSPPNSLALHQAREYLHLVAAMGASSAFSPATLFVTSGEVEAARQKFGLKSVSNLIFGLNPGAEYGPAKRWPIQRYIAVAKEIQRLANCAWILFGGNNDTEAAKQIQSVLGQEPAVFNVAGKTSLRELMALMKVCRVFLTNDTGPMHVAAALGVQVVAIFGSTSPELTGPSVAGESQGQILASDAPCSPCFLRECPIDFRCMNGIGVEPVVDAVLKSIE